VISARFRDASLLPLASDCCLKAEAAVSKGSIQNELPKGNTESTE
jgi:hypothetical protein